MIARDFLDDFVHMSTFGATDGGGIDRQAGTADDLAVRAWLRKVFTELGLCEHVDAIGNQFGLKEYIPGSTVLVDGFSPGFPADGRQI